MCNFIDGESRIRDLHRNFLTNFLELDQNTEVPDFVEDEDQEMREDEIRPNKQKDSFLASLLKISKKWIPG